MELFWAQGYEGVSLLELQKAMGGIPAPSFYHSFGSKEKLFREAVMHYAESYGAPAIQALMSGMTARASLEAMLRRAIEAYTQKGKPGGCMVMLGALSCSRTHRRIQAFMQEKRCNAAAVIRSRLDRGVTEGDLPKSANLGALTSFYSTVLGGLALRARDGVARAELNQTVDDAMAAWDVVGATDRKS